ncbi:hypothetical protein BU24DRAFT_481019 [Aaosphaeria arxii CBS 175.79]|uniref:G domain-containing protein n=1 Tax=Aaosphaeria arxii CBS 175.79 TaxID=1450172 RepID=A0A6A5XUC1_9PLEO|nr:uncharacterized protein BU24DRAFT_481019 [Aaosphaeria arxii CBS 175.79]KAF2016407.1 hypothetical protein BU24DRAFT_481019 [Aaosphaeria arxii CBS 175.79]
MTDWRAYHARIVRDFPSRSQLPPGSYVAGIREPANSPTEEARIFKFGVNSFAFEGNIQPPATFISELDIYGDRFVLLQACLTDSALPTMSRHMPVSIVDDSEVAPVQVDPESAITEPVHTIRRLIEQDDPDILEAGVRQGIKTLEQLRDVFSQAVVTTPEAQVWLDSITDLLSTPKHNRQYFGVVGNTGAGKSSIINALLDEERLVPTNCMRACTAVVTEISWNEFTNPGHRYRAEIEFLTPEEWRLELSLLLDETSNDGTVFNDMSNSGTAAGVAWAKLQALFPELTKAMVPSCTLDSLMTEQSVAQLLGKTICIASSEAGDFYRQVQTYVDSKEKSSGKSKKDKDGSAFGFWPLIKVVRIYVRSAVLANGAVLVDLPGLQDDNAARAAVADSYIRKCNGMLIVAPITRAVDDKSAKDLLGDTFRRQLKFDCAFSGITFVCSKTDDIEIREAAESLRIQDQISGFQEEIDNSKTTKKHLEIRRGTLRERLEGLNSYYDDLYEKEDQWQSLQQKLESGEQVYAPQEASGKRRKGNARGNAQKRSRLDHSDHAREYISDSESDEDIMKRPPVPLTIDSVQQALKNIRSERHELRTVRNDTTTEIKEVNEALKDADARIAANASQIAARCISERNNYSRQRIQRDFATGVKEVDEESAIRSNEQQFDPEDAIRDYDEIANALPVFCVSSRAYQRLQGRSEDDGVTPGFSSLLQTEVPQLQSHYRELTKHKRIQSARTFLQDLCSEILSCHKWSKNTNTVATSNKEIRDPEAMLCQLESVWDTIAEECSVKLKELVCEKLHMKCRAVADNATDEALEISRNWVQGRSDHGLPFQTYKAVVRRHGVFHSNSSGIHDFNADLMKPIMKQLGATWERTFQSRVPKALDECIKRFQAELRSFYSAVNADSLHRAAGDFNDITVERQAQRAEQSFDTLRVCLLEEIMEEQRNANREFVPVVKSEMHDAYVACSAEKGVGSFARMKSTMDTHVDNKRHTMFHSAIDRTAELLDRLCAHIEKKIKKKVKRTITHLRANHAARPASLAKTATRVQEHVDFKAEVFSILQRNNERFGTILNGEADADVVEFVKNEFRGVSID